MDRPYELNVPLRNQWRLQSPLGSLSLFRLVKSFGAKCLPAPLHLAPIFRVSEAIFQKIEAVLLLWETPAAPNFFATSKLMATKRPSVTMMNPGFKHFIH